MKFKDCDKEASVWIKGDNGAMYLVNPKFLKVNEKRVIPKRRSESVDRGDAQGKDL